MSQAAFRQLEHLRKVNRALTAVDKCHQALLYATDVSTLPEQVCQLLSRHSGYRAVWVSVAAGDDEGRRHSPVVGATEGFAGDTWDYPGSCPSPAGTAIRTAQPCLCANVRTDVRFPAWRDKALQHGYLSVLAIPVLVDDRSIGAFALCSQQTDAFCEEEARLLLQLANDFAHRLGMLQSEAAPAPAEALPPLNEERARLNLDNTLSPDEDPGDLELADIIDAPALQCLMDEFYKLSHIPTGIIDLKGRVLVAAGWQAVCLRFHRVHPETYQNCIESDVELSGGVAAGQYRIYKCKNSLWEAVTPITVGGKHLGNFFSGQFFLDDEQLDGSLFRQQARRYGFNEADYIAALECVPRLTRDTLAASMSYFMKLADIISRLGYSNIRLVRLLAAHDKLARSLDETSRELREVMDSVPDLLWSADIDSAGRFNPRYISPMVEKITGRPPSFYATPVDRWWSIVHPEDTPLLQASRSRLTSFESSAEEIEYRVTLPDGSVRWVRDSVSAVPAGDRGVRLHGVISDITERKRLEDQLLESQKLEAIGRLAGGIAHDFNNLMTIVTGYSELLQPSLRSSPELREKLEEIQNAGNQATSLTRQLLAFSRRQVLQLTELNLNDVLRPMVSMLQRLLTENIELQIQTDPDSAWIRCNRGQIEQVLMNLVINARDAMPEGGKLFLATAGVNSNNDPSCPHSGPSAEYVRLTVSDTGCGMDAHTRAHIFEPFFTTKPEGQGTGLGLATVYGIVKQAGGAITITSEPGRGATFQIYWPRVAGSSKVITYRPETTELAEPSSGSETILVVEDKDGLRSLVTEILRQHGYRVLAASNGSEALLVVEEHGGGVDIVVTDLIMPRMGGRELVRALSARYPDLRALYMSGHVEDLAALLGPDSDFIDKPFTPKALLRKVRQILDTQFKVRCSA